MQCLLHDVSLSDYSHGEASSEILVFFGYFRLYLIYK